MGNDDELEYQIITQLNISIVKSIFEQIVDDGKKTISPIEASTCVFFLIQSLTHLCKEILNCTCGKCHQQNTNANIEAMEELITDILHEFLHGLKERNMISTLGRYPIFNKVEIEEEE